ncbi:hypothetical protein DEU56DRAFT_762278 [Suillus clintonianus]|uniref:uncharacterized protein n=1 Tax=Suillus clintonianus TaxID=1904413 RepID=UPI001B86208B|nr:uncharacterized protein DEU56DRAFT_762278 [Suillus clintonianus]KAG2110786.1 hypothetical protein DEU56DRAFT_762278 [Suillus clintonianus]
MTEAVLSTQGDSSESSSSSMSEGNSEEGSDALKTEWLCTRGDAEMRECAEMRVYNRVRKKPEPYKQAHMYAKSEGDNIEDGRMQTGHGRIVRCDAMSAWIPQPRVMVRNGLWKVPAPSKRLTDASNSATPELSAHLEAIALKRAEDAKRLAEDTTTAPDTSSSHFVTPAKRSQNTDSSSSGDDTDCSAAPKPPKKKSHSSQSVIISSDSEESRAAPATAKKNKAPDPVNDDGFLADINIVSLSHDEIKQKPEKKGPVNVPSTP